MRLRCKHKPEQNKYERNAMTKLKVLSKNARQKKFCNLFSQVIADAYLQTCMQGRSPGSDNVFLSLSDLKQQATIHTIARILILMKGHGNELQHFRQRFSPISPCMPTLANAKFMWYISFPHGDMCH